MSNEVKRYVITAESGYDWFDHPEGKWIQVEDHDAAMKAKDAEIEILRSKATQFESTLKATMESRDHARAVAEEWNVRAMIQRGIIGKLNAFLVFSECYCHTNDEEKLVVCEKCKLMTELGMLK